MRIPFAALILLLAACSSAQTVDEEPAARCESTNCFNQLRIRDFKVIDPTTLIVYVGTQRCPFRVDLTGTFCDITFLPTEPVFRPSRMRATREPSTILNDRPSVLNSRVCSTDFDLGLEEGPFTQSAGATSDPRGLDCRIRDVESLTDDEVIELYVSKRIAPPPPPLGSGQIEVEQPDAEQAPAEETPPDKDDN